MGKNDSKQTILIAEDDESVRLLMRSVLERAGYIVEEAADGVDALTLYEKIQPDVVLMDAVMPKMDGFEACRNIQEKHGDDRAPVLMVTSLNDEVSIEQAFDAGALDFITKPIHWPVLFQRLLRIIDVNITKRALMEERKKAEEAKRKFEHQLRQAHKMEAIGRMSSGIAHNFNNILACILGYTGLALEKYAAHDKKLSSYLIEIHQAGERARDLIKQILLFSRDAEIEAKEVDLYHLSEEVVRLLHSTLPSTIRLTLNTKRDLPHILVNSVQMHQIIMNLCINARDAMDNKGEIVINLENVCQVKQVCSSCNERFAGDYVVMSVKDSGKGINPELLDRMFDPFFTTKEVGKGTGMGLSMVHGVMHNHGGHIVVESYPEHGTTFYLYLKDDKLEGYAGEPSYVVRLPGDNAAQRSIV